MIAQKPNSPLRQPVRCSVVVGFYILFSAFLGVQQRCFADAKRDVMNFRRGKFVHQVDFLGWTTDGRGVFRQTDCNCYLNHVHESQDPTCQLSIVVTQAAQPSITYSIGNVEYNFSHSESQQCLSHRTTVLCEDYQPYRPHEPPTSQSPQELTSQETNTKLYCKALVAKKHASQWIQQEKHILKNLGPLTSPSKELRASFEQTNSTDDQGFTTYSNNQRLIDRQLGQELFGTVKGKPFSVAVNQQHLGWEGQGVGLELTSPLISKRVTLGRLNTFGTNVISTDLRIFVSPDGSRAAVWGTTQTEVGGFAPVETEHFIAFDIVRSKARLSLHESP